MKFNVGEISSVIKQEIQQYRDEIEVSEVDVESAATLAGPDPCL